MSNQNQTSVHTKNITEWRSKYTVAEIEAHAEGYKHCVDGGEGPNPHVEESSEWQEWEHGWGIAKSMMEKDCG